MAFGYETHEPIINHLALAMCLYAWWVSNHYLTDMDKISYPIEGFVPIQYSIHYFRCRRDCS